jgi:hypothetical protein
LTITGERREFCRHPQEKNRGKMEKKIFFAQIRREISLKSLIDNSSRMRYNMYRGRKYSTSKEAEINGHRKTGKRKDLR